MQILTIDIGTGTQDIFLYDSRLDIENGFKLVVPSPTMMVHQQVKEITRRGEPLLLTGTIMGGGPSQWAVESHARLGLPVYATPEAAASFNDDLEKVIEMGVVLVSEDETAALNKRCAVVELKDFDFSAIARSLSVFGVSLEHLEAVAVAVFDHGNAPPDISDRQFRFDYLDDRLRSTRGLFHHPLSAFAFPANEIPPIMTRLQAVVGSAQRDPGFPNELPLIVMDTAPAAVLGATFDPKVAARQRVMIANIGNFHTLAFRLGPGGVEGVFEHHTGLIDQAQLETLLLLLADSSLRHADVFEHHGHGALVYNSTLLDLSSGDYGLAVTGPRRSLLKGSRLGPYFAVPFGDMMIAGCFGLLAAAADHLPDLAGPVRKSLASSTISGVAPWDV